MANNSVQCEVVAETTAYVPLAVAQWIQAVTSVAAIALVTLVVPRYLKRCIFENTFKEIIVAIAATIVAHSVATTVVQFAHIISKFVAKTACDAQIDKRFCILRSVAMALFPLIAWLHASITVQRIFTSFSASEWAHRWIGRICIGVSIIYAGIHSYLVTDPSAFTGTTAYCTGVTSNNVITMEANLHIIMVIDVVSISADFLLLKYNLRKIRMNRYQLTISFRRKQNIISMQQFLPVALLNTIFYLFTYGVNMYGINIFGTLAPPASTAMVAFMNLVPWYCVLFPLMLYASMEWRAKRRTSELIQMAMMHSPEEHFITLAAMWRNFPLGSSKSPSCGTAEDVL